MNVLALTARLRAAGCVFAEEEADRLLAAAPDAETLESMVRRRVDGVPLEHVLGFADFAGVRLVVTDGVFVPRHRTELLTTIARAMLTEGGVVLDLCCGTGALGLVVVKGFSGVRLVATDIDPAAVDCARRNLSGITEEVFAGDLFSAVPSNLRGTVDLLLANVPYVPTGEIAYLPEEFRVHEARAALDGGRDGLDVLRRVAAEAADWLAPGGALLTETGTDQLATARALLRAGGLHPRTITDEDTETNVVLAERRP
jgi:release factor glutamine methyltransferase